VVDPLGVSEEVIPTAAKKRKTRKEKGGIEEWFVNTRNEVPGIDDS
jgi:hypothetical protein